MTPLEACQQAREQLGALLAADREEQRALLRRLEALKIRMGVISELVQRLGDMPKLLAEDEKS